MNEWTRWREQMSRRLRLKTPHTIRYDFRKHTCGPTSFASVELAFAPSASFHFVRRCDWPSHLSPAQTRDVDAAMATGIHDALLPSNGSPYDAMGVSATCVGVEWDDVGSSEMAFYIAAWHATRQLREAGEWDLVPV